MRAEATAANEGLRFALDLGIRAIVLEGDARIIVDSFEESTMNLSHNGSILVDAYGLASRFNFFKANFVLRRCNIVADRVASLTNV